MLSAGSNCSAVYVVQASCVRSTSCGVHLQRTRATPGRCGDITEEEACHGSGLSLALAFRGWAATVELASVRSPLTPGVLALSPPWIWDLLLFVRIGWVQPVGQQESTEAYHEKVSREERALQTILRDIAKGMARRAVDIRVSSEERPSDHPSAGAASRWGIMSMSSALLDANPCLGISA